MLEHRCDLFVEEEALFGLAAGCHDCRWVDAVEFCGAVAGGNEQAKQAGLVEISVEGGDFALAAPVAAFPIGVARGIEMRCDAAVIGMELCLTSASPKNLKRLPCVGSSGPLQASFC